jgi:tetratricopeptide (TPR) repeat protein
MNHFAIFLSIFLISSSKLLEETRALIQAGSITEARKLLMARDNPTDEEVYWLAKLYFLGQDYDSTQIWVDELFQLHPHSQFLNDALLLELFIASSKGEGLDEISQAMLRYEEGARQLARDGLKDIIAQGGGLADDAYLLMAQFYEAEGEVELARAALEELRSQFPESFLIPQAMLDEALLYHALGKDKSFKRLLEELILKYPVTPQAFIARGYLTEGSKSGLVE